MDRLIVIDDQDPGHGLWRRGGCRLGGRRRGRWRDRAARGTDLKRGGSGAHRGDLHGNPDGEG